MDLDGLASGPGVEFQLSPMPTRLDFVVHSQTPLSVPEQSQMISANLDAGVRSLRILQFRLHTKELFEFSRFVWTEMLNFHDF